MSSSAPSPGEEVIVGPKRELAVQVETSYYDWVPAPLSGWCSTTCVLIHGIECQGWVGVRTRCRVLYGCSSSSQAAAAVLAYLKPLTRESSGLCGHRASLAGHRVLICRRPRWGGMSLVGLWVWVCSAIPGRGLVGTLWILFGGVWGDDVAHSTGSPSEPPVDRDVQGSS